MIDELEQRRKKIAQDLADAWRKKRRLTGQVDAPPVPEWMKPMNRATEPFNAFDEALSDILEDLAALTIPAIAQLCPTLREERGQAPPFDEEFAKVQLDEQALRLWDLKSAVVGGKFINAGRNVEPEPDRPSGPTLAYELRLLENGGWYELGWVGRWHQSEQWPNPGSLALVYAEPTMPFMAIAEYGLGRILAGMSMAFIKDDARPKGDLAQQYIRFLDLVERVVKATTPLEPLQKILAQRAKPGPGKK